MDKEKKDLEQWKKEFKAEMLEHVNQMNNLVREAESKKDFVALFEGTAKRWGGSCHVIIPKKYVGSDVRILVLNKKEESDQEKPE